MFERVLAPVQVIARAATRPATYPAQLREMTAAAVYAALWPWGLSDRGVAELRRRAERPGQEGDIDTPVLLLHGYGANKSNWRFLEGRLRDAGFGRIHALNYNPLISDVPALGAACARRARGVMEHFGVDRIHLVGHSLGGIVARHAVQIDGLEEAAACVTVSSPHRGSPLARFGPGATARQLRVGSPLLQRLAACSRPSATRFVAYYSNVDVLVPGRSGQLLDPALDATNILVKDAGHLSILLADKLTRSVTAELLAVEARGADDPVRPAA